MKDEETYYEILGIKKSASMAEIKLAYRKKSKEFHPDKVVDDETKKKNEVEFKKAQEAYEVLSDPAKKRKYDRRFSFEEEFKEKGWMGFMGKTNPHTGNLVGKSQLPELVQFIRKQHSNLKHAPVQKVLQDYLLKKSLHLEYDDTKPYYGVQSMGFVSIAQKAVKEKLISKKLPLNILHYTYKKAVRTNIKVLEILEQALLDTCTAIEGPTHEEMKRNQKYAVKMINRHIKSISVLTKNHMHHKVNPAHIYYSVLKALSLRKKHHMTDSEIEHHNDRIEPKLFNFYRRKLWSAIQDKSVVRTKWYLDMIKYICSALENYGRLDQLEHDIINKLTSISHHHPTFSTTIREYLGHIDESTNRQAHAAQGQEDRVIKLLPEFTEVR